MGVSGKDMTEL